MKSKMFILTQHYFLLKIGFSKWLVLSKKKCCPYVLQLLKEKVVNKSRMLASVPNRLQNNQVSQVFSKNPQAVFRQHLPFLLLGMASQQVPNTIQKVYGIEEYLEIYSLVFLRKCEYFQHITQFYNVIFQFLYCSYSSYQPSYSYNSSCSFLDLILFFLHVLNVSSQIIRATDFMTFLFFKIKILGFFLIFY